MKAKTLAAYIVGSMYIICCKSIALEAQQKSDVTFDYQYNNQNDDSELEISAHSNNNNNDQWGVYGKLFEYCDSQTKKTNKLIFTIKDFEISDSVIRSTIKVGSQTADCNIVSRNYEDGQYRFAYSYPGFRPNIINEADHSWSRIPNSELQSGYPAPEMVKYSLSRSPLESGLGTKINTFRVEIPRDAEAENIEGIIALRFFTFSRVFNLIVREFQGSVIEGAEFTQGCFGNQLVTSCNQETEDALSISGLSSTECTVNMVIKRNDYLAGLRSNNKYLHSVTISSIGTDSEETLIAEFDLFRNSDENSQLETPLSDEQIAIINDHPEQFAIRDASFFSEEKDLISLSISLPHVTDSNIKVTLNKNSFGSSCSDSSTDSISSAERECYSNYFSVALQDQPCHHTDVSTMDRRSPPLPSQQTATYPEPKPAYNSARTVNSRNKLLGALLLLPLTAGLYFK
ncbi:hypothetical protein EOPP23_19950 [Endozoicomonas sp. OPT23]|uniref:hypothetical protein n=1 Tax=Endozoicomonas sp. OPT23 TaxID=2072845 RepID=UPI00129AACF0|nr:hypothetical protein [Endozoicomonas sp. OPT23]MRI35246.1 hypothetical protein [Endozoicomonas sp. OPT23]